MKLDLHPSNCKRFKIKIFANKLFARVSQEMVLEEIKKVTF